MYLFPCSSCGRKTAIEPRQAGQTLRCQCGATSQTPTMLQIRDLEPAMSQGVLAARSSWGWPQALMLVGTVVVMAAVVAGGILYSRRPHAPAPRMAEFVAADIETSSPLRTFLIFRNHLQPGLDAEKPPVQKDYDRAMSMTWIGLALLGAAGTGGIALVVTGTVAWRRGQSRV
jgi:hypothetical protein